MSTMAAPQNTPGPGQIDFNEGERTPTSLLTSQKSPPKPRSLSDAPRPTLSPSPAFREPAPRMSKDDSAVSGPSTPKRPPIHLRGLSLQMPQKDVLGSSSGPLTAAAPLSPKLDSSQIYGSPASMLPRRSRGLDYTRACTNLHHSTLAESSPDASPTIGGRGIQIPTRRSLVNTVLDSPSNMSSSLWSSMPNADRTALSSSVSSVNMLDSDSDSDSSSNDMMIDREMDDPMLNTPAAAKLNANIMSTKLGSPGSEWTNNYTSPAQASLLSFTRARFRRGKSRHSSSSVSISSTKPSPGTLSPPLIKSIETANVGYFGSGMSRQQVQSRRESLSLGTNDLHLSDSEDGESGTRKRHSSSSAFDSSGPEGPRGVIRRAVTRRSNLLPKSKNFARIRAALMEESAPIDSEARREAEVIRQVHESEPALKLITSPVFQSSAQFTQEPETTVDENGTGHDNSATWRSSVSSDSFGRHAEKNSAGLGFWTTFDDRYRTPPPPLLPRDSSSALSDETVETPGSSIISTTENPALMHLSKSRSRSRSTTPLASAPPTAGDVARKVNNKRRRDDDFDPGSFKRRAVSPGMSVQSSPIPPPSPVLNNERSWGRPPPKHSDRSNSGGSVSNGMKRVGLQGMTETNDSLMNMSID
jgi:hypothetical protein